MSQCVKLVSGIVIINDHDIVIDSVIGSDIATDMVSVCLLLLLFLATSLIELIYAVIVECFYDC